MEIVSPHWQLFKELTRRELVTRYLENLTGLIWLVIQPLLMLAVYAFVFTQIFKARLVGIENIEYVPYLALAFWPWTAFSEAVMRGSSSVISNAALIGKVAIRAEILPVTTATAAFLMHTIGYVVILGVLELLGTDLVWLALPQALLLMITVYVFALGLTLIASALQVFIRDLEHIIPTLMMVWFFTSPILYSPNFIPEQYRWIFSINPFTWIAGRFRSLLVNGQMMPTLQDLGALLLAVLVLLLGLWLFRRLSPHFEDFL